MTDNKGNRNIELQLEEVVHELENKSCPTCGKDESEDAAYSDVPAPISRRAAAPTPVIPVEYGNICHLHFPSPHSNSKNCCVGLTNMQRSDIIKTDVQTGMKCVILNEES